jgi:negative regulator of sigma E activity
MKRINEEIISTLIDGEIHPKEERHLLKTISHGDELQKKWEHYHLIRDVLKRETLGIYGPILRSRIKMAIDNEPAFQLTFNKKRNLLFLALFAIIIVTVLGLLGFKF